MASVLAGLVSGWSEKAQHFIPHRHHRMSWCWLAGFGLPNRAHRVCHPKQRRAAPFFGASAYA